LPSHGTADNTRIRLVGLSEIDRNLLQRCLDRKPRAWEDFVDRFLGLAIHVVNHTAQARSIRVTPEDRDDLVGEIFLSFIKNDFAVLRHFRGASSLATYLTVVARRVTVKAMLSRKAMASLTEGAISRKAEPADPSQPEPERGITNREEVEQMLGALDGQEAEVVRMFHFESKSYQEIGRSLGIAENSVGPILTRARTKMRSAGVNPARN
jgi:RNA polymerase sigma-70 factor (ECF subfamily)